MQNTVQCYIYNPHDTFNGTNQFFLYMNNNDNTQTVATLSQLLEIPFWRAKERVLYAFKVKGLKKQKQKGKKKEKKKKVD